MRCNSVYRYLSLMVFALALSVAPLSRAGTFQIPLKSVSSVSLLIADPGAAEESSHGHAALRFSFWKGLSDRDLVVSYGAKTPKDASGNETESDFMKFLHGTGLSGHYPSEVVAENYSQFKKQYRKESRGVHTFVLALKPDEVARIVPYVNAQLQAGHARRDFHILNYNCAVMSIEALNSGLSSPIRDGGTNYPDKLPGIVRSHRLVASENYDTAQ